MYLGRLSNIWETMRCAKRMKWIRVPFSCDHAVLFQDHTILNQLGGQFLRTVSVLMARRVVN
jgi:hypothetical protein